MVNFVNKLDSIYQQALEKVSDLQPWLGHYLVRRTETEILTHQFNFDKDYIGLELGCGNAFQSTLLASLSNRIFATDLFQENGATHSLGIKKAQDLIDKLNVENITLVSCSAVSLPFVDNYFDFVFSSSVLEHVNDRILALSEMRRVLRKDGYLILIIPTHMVSIYAFPHAFLYILARIAKSFFNSLNKFNMNAQKNTRSSKDDSLVKRFRKNHPSFPLPEPHGAYRSILQELNQQFPRRWSAMLKESGFKVIKSFSTCLMPWLLIEPFSTLWPAHLYYRTKRLHFKLSDSKLGGYLGYSTCFIAVKNE